MCRARKGGRLGLDDAPLMNAIPEKSLAPTLPLRLGRFTLCEEVGAGGMATVYLARMGLAAGLERLVALKTIHPHLAKESAFVDMFLDEARIASHVTHPNVCSTHDFGEVDGVYYLAMEYLLGEPVFDVINRLVEAFDEVREVLPYLAARILADACEGLHAAHNARGPNGERLHIVHRDVSPQNLFLTYDGSVKIVDFGCAKAAERVAHTSMGVMKGKVGYASPEQIKGKAVDARADVWALGVCLWEALTLSPLFSRDTAVSTAMAVLEEEIELASDGRDWVPEEIATIAGRALSRDPDGRFATARDMGRALRKFIADSGHTLESAEVAEWMDFLFEDRHLEREEQATRVQELDISDVTQTPLYEVEPDEIEPDEVEPDELESDELETADSNATPIESEEEEVLAEKPAPVPLAAPEPAKPDALLRWVVALLIVAALAVGGYYLLARSEQSGPGPEPEPTSEVEPEPEPAVNPQPEVRANPTPAEEPVEPEPEPEPPAPADPPPQDESTPPERSRRSRRRSRPRPSAPSPPEATPGTGNLRIDTSGGWAEVYEGSHRLGRTPLNQELPIGRHRLRILPFGREDAAETISVYISTNVGESLTLDVGAP